MHFQALSDLVGSIYDTVVDASACPRMLNGLAELLGATGGAQVGAYNSKADTATMLAPRVDPRELPIFSKYWTKRLAAVRPESDRRRHLPGNANFSPGSPPPRDIQWVAKAAASRGNDGNNPVDRGSDCHGGLGVASRFRGRVRRGRDPAVRRPDPASAARGAAAIAPGRPGRAADELGRDAQSAAARGPAGRRAGASNLRQPSRHARSSAPATACPSTATASRAKPPRTRAGCDRASPIARSR